MVYYNTDKYDFWEIYDTVKKYYPIGIPKNDTGLYMSYPGLQEVDRIVRDHIYSEVQFSIWTNFENEVKGRLGKPVIGTTYGRAPCYSSSVILESKDYTGFVKNKEVHFFVSLLGPFYTIIGRDINTVKINDMSYVGTNYLVISSVNEFEDTFGQLCKLIEGRFKGYRFVPFNINTILLKGLDLHYTEKSGTIFSAIFNDSVDFSVNIVGNEFFKYEQWIRS